MLITMTMIETEMTLALRTLDRDKLFGTTVWEWTSLLPFFTFRALQILIRDHIVFHKWADMIGRLMMILAEDELTMGTFERKEV